MKKKITALYSKQQNNETETAEFIESSCPSDFTLRLKNQIKRIGNLKSIQNLLKFQFCKGKITAKK